MLDGKIKDSAETGKMLHYTPVQYKDEDPCLREADDTVIAEGLANRKFYKGKSTSDNGSGKFLSILEYKQADRG